ncbi:MAG: substrate-binding domain-containing protein [Spirochaetia bacterium]
MKKSIFSILLLAAISIFSCANPANKDAITVVSREASSGTRGAFDEIVGVSVKNGDDIQNNLFKEALIVGSNDSAVLTVSKNPQGIGYASPVGLGESVKILEIDGILPTMENIVTQKYPIYRPFGFVHTQKSLDNPLVKDFLSFVFSQQGQQIIMDNGYVPAANAIASLPNYNPAPDTTGKIVLSGSTSVQKIIQKLQEAYQLLQPGVQMEIQFSGSVSGIKDVTAGKVDLGMTSRDLREEEKVALGNNNPLSIFNYDAVAIIVNAENPLNALSMQEVEQIFIGNIRTWSTLSPAQDEMSHS